MQPAISEKVMWRVGQYEGQESVAVAPTQLESLGFAKRSEEPRVLQEWIDFFEAGPSPMLSLSLRSRTPQNLLDSLNGQPQLVSLDVKFGPYADLGVLAVLPNLADLSLGGATGVVSLDPLASLSSLQSLSIDQAHLVRDLRPLSRLGSLRELAYGNGYPGSDKRVAIDDLEWVRPLLHLERLRLPGSLLRNSDLSALLELPNLIELRLPLREVYRKQVTAFAAQSAAFAGLLEAYEGLDEYRRRTGS